MTLTCVSICSIGATHTQVRVLLVWMIGKVVAFPHSFSSFPALHSKYGLVCLSSLSSPHFFPLFVLLFLFFHPAFCSLPFFSLFLQLCSGIQGFTRRKQRLGTARLSDKQRYAELQMFIWRHSQPLVNILMLFCTRLVFNIGMLYTECVVKTIFQWCDVQVCGLVSLNLRLSQVAGHMSWLSVQCAYVHIQRVHTESEWRLN